MPVIIVIRYIIKSSVVLWLSVIRHIALCDKDHLQVSSSESNEYPRVYEDEPDSELKLTIKPRTTCKFFPWKNHEKPIDLGLSCRQKDSATSTMEVKYRTDIEIQIRACFMSSESSGAIDRPCCADNGTECISSDSNSLINLVTNRSYLIHFYNRTDRSSCRVSFMIRYVPNSSKIME